MRKFSGYAIWAIAALMAVFMAYGCACENDECKKGGGGWLAASRPTVIFVTPLNTDTGVPINRKITATFSEAMDSPATINTATFTVAGPGGPVIGTVTYDAINHIAIFTPTGNLLPLTTYTATITLGALNLAGVSLAQPFVWIFTTGAAADVTGPSVTFTIPLNLASLVPFNSAVNATFSEAMDPFTLTPVGQFTLKQGLTVIPGTVTYIGLIATFKPTSPLAPNTVYTATVSPTATDLAGNALIAGLAPNPWTFTTGAAPDTTRPTVISVFPANLATDVPINTTISALFSEAMDPNSITFFGVGTIVPSANGIVSYDPLTHIGTFIPNSPLAANTTYTVTITTQPMDLAGNHLLNPYVWSFKTAATLDTTSPYVSLTNPVHLAPAVPVTASILATFNEDMKLTTINDVNFTLTRPGPISVTGLVTYNVLTKTATFKSLAPLLASTTYTARISTGAQDLAGNPLVSPVPPGPLGAVNNPWTFTTAAAPVIGPLPIDLGAAFNFVILSGSGISSVPTSAITGNIGVSPAAGTFITGLTCPEVTGTIFTVTASGPACRVIDPAGLTAAKAALTVAYSEAAGRSVPAPVTVSGDQGGITRAPGIYKSTSSLSIASGDLTLDAGGDANAVWVFQIASTLTTVGCGAAVPPGCGTGGNVRLINSANAANVFWQVGTSATIGDHTVFAGTILANIDISVNTGSQITGRLLSGAQPSGAGAVTLISDTVVLP